MANLAIQGHATRGSEVIALLEMLGGKNTAHFKGEKAGLAYYIEVDKSICCIDIEFEYHTEFYKITVEEFEEKFPYKVGDKVSSKYLKNYEISKMEWESINNRVIYKLRGMGWYSADELQPYKEETMETKKITITPQRHWNEDKIELEVTNDYEIKEENGKFYAVKKQSKYPKNYVECCKVLGCKADYFFTDFSYDNCDVEISDYEDKIDDLLQIFRKLRYCRDAYWKIAGEQMGLGKPWEPDWLNVEQDKYVLFTHNNAICSNRYVLGHNILAFPTEEMRDAFYENFKELIETCKELL